MVGTGMPDRDLPLVEANPQNRDRASKAGAGGAQRSHGRQIGNHSSTQSPAFWTVSGPTQFRSRKAECTTLNPVFWLQCPNFVLMATLGARGGCNYQITSCFTPPLCLDHRLLRAHSRHWLNTKQQTIDIEILQ